MLVYKVVRKAEGFYCSAMIDGKWQARYELGEDTFPVNSSLLFAFEDVEKARAWVDEVSSSLKILSLLECEADIETPLEKIAYWLHVGELDLFWSPWRGYYQSLYLPPEGTVFCSRIKPVREI